MPKGAIVVAQEIFGVNRHIRSICDRLANEGHAAFAPSIFDRIEPNFQSGYSSDEVQNALRKFAGNPDWAALLRDTQAAIDAAKSIGAVGIIGFCSGGASPTWRSSYDKTSSDIAWPRSLQFFAKHLHA